MDSNLFRLTRGISCLSVLLRVLDLEPESEEDEDAIIERRRQLRQAIVQKYHHSAPTSPRASSPAPSEADSETIGERVEAELKEEGRRLEEVDGDGEEVSRLTKKDPKEEQRAQDELRKKKTSLSALRESIRNGDMFCEEDLFTEMQLVKIFFFSYILYKGHYLLPQMFISNL